jgi:site-specific DNA recombinase
MIKNPAYTGMAALNKTHRVERRPRLRPRRGQSEFPRRNSCTRDTSLEEQTSIPVPAIVDQETFAAAQEQLAHNRKHHGRRPRPGRYLLQGLVVCAQCGRAYYGACSGSATGRSKEREQARSYGYYRCCGTDRANFGGTPVCFNRTVRTDRLDAAVWEDVRGLLLEPGRIEAEYQRRQERPAGPRDQSRQAIDTQIRGLKRRIARLTEMYEEGFLERDAFRDRMASARTRLDSMEADARLAAEQEASESELRLVIGQLQAFSQQLRSGLEDCTPQARQEIVRALVKRVEVEEQNVRIVYKVSPVPFDGPPPLGGGVMGSEVGVSGNCGRRVAPAFRADKSGGKPSHSKGRVAGLQIDGAGRRSPIPRRRGHFASVGVGLTFGPRRPRHRREPYDELASFAEAIAMGLDVSSVHFHEALHQC